MLWALVAFIKIFNLKGLSLLNDYVAFNIDKALPNVGSIANFLLSSINSFGTFLSFILDLSDNDFDGFYRLNTTWFK